jgi:hypothetical protein
VFSFHAGIYNGTQGEMKLGASSGPDAGVATRVTATTRQPNGADPTRGAILVMKEEGERPISARAVSVVNAWYGRSISANPILPMEGHEPQAA